MRKLLAGVAIGFGLTTSVAAQQPLRYEVSSPHPATHLLHLRFTVPADYGCPDLTFAAWTPGGYVINRHAGRVLDARFSSSSGRELSAIRRDLDSWKVNCDSTQGYSAELRIYSKADKNPYSAHIDDRLLFANLVTVLPYLESHRDAPAHFVIRPPSGWRAVCSLPPVPNQTLTYRADDWDHLADAIFAASPSLMVLPFSVDETQLSIALTEAPGVDVDLTSVVHYHRELTRAAARTFGGLPFERYLFLYKVGPEGSRGGLEHAESTAMGCTRDAIESTGDLLGLIELASHELVHAWNVKRARPRALTPYDYSDSQLSELLWVSEGWTSYYAPLLLTRAGLHTREELYDAIANRINRHRSNPTNKFRSLNDISRDSWLRWTIPFFTFRTYYVKGALTGLDLDLRLRAAGAANGIDELMGVLLTDPTLRHRGFTLADIKFHASRLAGQPMDAWFRNAAELPGFFDVSESLAAVGLRLEVDADRLPRSYSGVALEESDGSASIQWVEPDGPGARAGLGTGDFLLAVNGVSGDLERLQAELRDLPPDVTAQLTIRRRHHIQEVKLQPVQPSPERFAVRIVEVAQPTDAQLALRDAWLWKLN